MLYINEIQYNIIYIHIYNIQYNIYIYIYFCTLHFDSFSPAILYCIYIYNII